MARGAPEPISDETIARARDCDPDAWELIYRRMYQRLFGFARSRLATGTQADDAVSEALARAIEAVDRYQPGSAGLEGWLFGVLRNVVNETYRDTGRVRPTEGIDDRPDPAPDPSEAIITEDEGAQVRAAFGRLEPGEQEVLSLRVVGALDAEAAGAVLGKRAGAVRMAQSRALGRMRLMLSEEVG